MTATAERSEELAAGFERETVDVLELLTLRVNELSDQNASLLLRVNAQSALVQELNEAQLCSQLESAQYELYLQDCQIAELKQSIEDLMAGSAVTVDRSANPAPVITDRFMHKQTAKGWRLDESSLTIDWKGAVPDSATRARFLRESYADGLAEAELRNREPDVLALS